MRIDEAATWICVVSTVFFTRKRQGSHFFVLASVTTTKKMVFSEILKNEFTNFQ